MRLSRVLTTVDGAVCGILAFKDDLEVFIPINEAISRVNEIEGLAESLGIPEVYGVHTAVFSESVGSEIKGSYLGKSFVNICRRIRRYASRGEIAIDTSEHVSNNGLNVKLFRIIEALRMSVESFICSYLSVLQPYSLGYFMQGKTPKGHVWMQDIGYGVSLVIKVDESNKNRPVVVSFHESNRGGVTRRSVGLDTSELCGVVVDNVTASGSDYYVKYTVQRGFIRHTLTASSSYVCNDIALVPLADISSRFDRDLSHLVRKLMQKNVVSDFDIQTEIVDAYVNVDKFSFPAIGRDPLNVLCMLIDISSEVRNNVHVGVIGHLALSILSDLSITRRSEVLDALRCKYGTSPNRLYNALIGGEIYDIS